MSVSVRSSSVLEQVVNENRARQIELLTAVNDGHGGVIVEMKETMDSEGKKGVWVKLPNELVNLVEAAVKEGFWYHHAEPKYLMLVYWIPETSNTLPSNATHQIGIGAFVMNDKREALVVKENSGKFQGTAIREVKEETGIDTEFVEVLAFRQSRKSFFEKSDLFFICMLRPLSSDIQKQEVEIEEAKRQGRFL